MTVYLRWLNVHLGVLYVTWLSGGEAVRKSDLPTTVLQADGSRGTATYTNLADCGNKVAAATASFLSEASSLPQSSNWSMIFGTGMEKHQNLFHKGQCKWSAPEHLQHHLVKDDAFLWGFTLPQAIQPCTACSCRKTRLCQALYQPTSWLTTTPSTSSNCRWSDPMAGAMEHESQNASPCLAEMRLSRFPLQNTWDSYKGLKKNL